MAESTGTEPRDRTKRANGAGSVYPYRTGFRAAFTWKDDAGASHRTVRDASTLEAAQRALERLGQDPRWTPATELAASARALREWHARATCGDDDATLAALLERLDRALVDAAP